MNRLFSEFDAAFDAPFFGRPYASPFSGLTAMDDDLFSLPALMAPQPTPAAAPGTAVTAPSTTNANTAVGAAAGPSSGSNAMSVWNQPNSPFGWLKAMKPMSVDVHENDTAVTVSADLPGYNKTDVQCAIENGVLTITATRNQSVDSSSATATPPAAGAKPPSPESKVDTKHSTDAKAGDVKAEPAAAAAAPQYRRIERSYGHISRSFKLPASVDASKVSAGLDNGVLTITLPKRPAVAPAKQQILIK